MDLRKLKTLIDLVSESNVSELEITEAEGKVRIVKSAPVGMAAPVAYTMAPAAAPLAAPAAAVPVAVEAAPPVTPTPAGPAVPPLTSAGPKLRAGFIDAPLMMPANIASVQTAQPTAKPAISPTARWSVATETTTTMSRKVSRSGPAMLQRPMPASSAISHMPHHATMSPK